MKRTVKILSALLAVMMICMTFAVTAGADEVNTLTLSSTKTGFTFSIFKLADLNETTGDFTVNADLADDQEAEVKAKLEVVDTTNEKAAAIARYLDGEISGLSKDKQKAILGEPVATFAVTDSYQTMTTTALGDAIYYVTALAGDTPANVTKNQGSIFVLPEYNPTSSTWNHTVTVTLDNKVSFGDADVDKTIVSSKDYTVSSNNKAAITDETTPVKFELSASIVGSKEQPLKTYVIGDNMDDGLTYVAGQKPVVKLVKGATEYALSSGTQYEVKMAPSYKDGAYKYTFSVELDPTVFDKNAIHNGISFYDYEKVVVQYVATINENIEVQKAEDNKDFLLYQNNGGSFTEVEGTVVKVYTLGVDITKFDAVSTDKKKLDGAEFTLYTRGADGKLIELAKATSTVDGCNKFYAPGETDEYNVKPGNYVIIETKAPVGYTLDTTEIPVVITAGFVGDTLEVSNEGYFSYECGNRPIILPATGGAGTIMFTIVGAVLISLAGVLFYAVMRKKNPTK